MNSTRSCQLVTALLVVVSSHGSIAQSVPGRADASTVEIRSGAARFEVGTNLPVVSIHGKTTALEGWARIRQDGDNLVIERLEATLPVKSLKTGIALRDEHMRKLVFTAPDGSLPDMSFVAEDASCLTAVGTRTCRLAGTLSVRGVGRPFSIAVNVRGDGESLRASGEGSVRLSTYEIPPPSQLGVTTLDEVKLRLDFTVRRVAEPVALRTSR